MERTRLLRLLLVTSVFLGLVACVTHLRRPQGDVPVQSWWDERGPVVPHDSYLSSACYSCHPNGTH